MNTIEKIEDVIENLRNDKTEEILTEEQSIANEIALIKECQSIIGAGEEEFINYNFDNIINLLNGTEFRIDNINKIIGDIKNVFIVKKNLGNDDEISLDESQVADFNKLLENLVRLNNKLNQRLEELKTVKRSQNESKITEIQALKDILEGKGRRRYYTKGMINAFMSEVDIKKMDPSEALAILEGFFNTRNMATETTYNPKQEEPEDFEEIVNLFKSFLPDYFETSKADDGEDVKSDFENNLIKRKKNIIYEIDLDNTREVLNWLRERGLLRRFDNRAIIEIAVYGEVNILEKAYEGLKLNNSYIGDKAYTYKYSTFWINYSEETRRYQRLRGYKSYRKRDGGNTPRERYTASVTGEELIDNIKLVEQLVREGLLDPSKQTDNEIIIFKTNWRLEKNVKLAKVFNIGKKDESYLASTYLYGKDTERAINAAVELGLLHPPMDEESKEMEKRIPKNQEFQANEAKKEKENTSIRDYYSRHASKFVELSDDMIRYLSYIAETEGYEELYKYIFSDKFAGLAEWDNIRDMRSKVRESSIIAKLCSLSDFPEIINEYDKIDEEVIEYELESKNNNKDYINPKILDNELIIELEEKYRVEDELETYDGRVSKPNNYLYKIGDRLISRKKVLHIATILYEAYDYLDRDMILYAVTKDSYFNEDNFSNIVEAIKGKGKEKTV